MTSCSYCHRLATTTIVATPPHVCLEHATEFWTGLLDFTRDRVGPCVKAERLCTCRVCADTETSRMRAAAILSVGPSPGDHVDFQIARAS